MRKPRWPVDEPRPGPISRDRDATRDRRWTRTRRSPARRRKPAVSDRRRRVGIAVRVRSHRRSAGRPIANRSAVEADLRSE